MKRRTGLVPLLAVALLSLAVLTCNRSASGQPTLVPSLPAPGDSPAATDTSIEMPTTTPSAVPTLAPSATPTLSPTPTPTPTPTPLPAVLLREAQEALHNGDPAAARTVLSQLPVEGLGVSEAAAAQLGLARSALEAGDYAGAMGPLRDFLSTHPDHPRAPEAQFLLGEALMAQGDYAAAAAAYGAYLDTRDVIAPYVLLWIGDAHTAAGAYTDAIDAYEQAVVLAPTTAMLFQVREKLALAYGFGGDPQAALAQYDAILVAAEDANLRARIQYQAAQTLLVSGEREAAYARLYDLVADFYRTAPAYDALVDLIDSGQPVDDYQRGLVDYYNDAYDAAVAAFYRAIEADPRGHVGAPHYFAGLAYRDARNYAAAVIEFDKLIQTHPGDPYVDDAWLAKAWTRYLADDADAAVETYTRFVRTTPSSVLAPEALWWAANIRYWNDQYDLAAVLFSQLAADYPSSEYAAEALYRAAFSHYQLQAYREAEQAWLLFSRLYPTEELAIGAQFWRGRAHLAAGETLSATQAFSRAVEIDPVDYYSQRALDYLAEIPSDTLRMTRQIASVEQTQNPFGSSPFELPGDSRDEAVERAATDLWLADWLGLSSTEAVTLSRLSAVLAADLRLLRGEELWRLGRRAEAKDELEWLRADTATDLRSQYQLAIFFRDLGLYRSSILAANAALRLSPARSCFEAPAFLSRLAYPTYYADLVLPEAAANDLDPLLLFALIRQESLFEGFATSYASAYGLMQIIPSTGQGIANSLGWSGYDTSDLYRPYISVKFGTWYLARQRDAFDGLAYPALAAYNAGPGNAARWLRRATLCPEGVTPGEGDAEICAFDYDRFVEIIDLRETRLYIRQIYKHFSVYQHLYGVESE
jgi:soluble lytic murein transglycosylase